LTRFSVPVTSSDALCTRPYVWQFPFAFEWAFHPRPQLFNFFKKSLALTMSILKRAQRQSDSTLPATVHCFCMKGATLFRIVYNPRFGRHDSMNELIRYRFATSERQDVAEIPLLAPASPAKAILSSRMRIRLRSAWEHDQPMAYLVGKLAKNSKR
jgi:hypothetical protein